ncbi:MAG: hypothetical protein HY322_18580 [Betaproteobacteria bacterium]|nr:hypothetical protein [Betaproteobacteria bacterium]
MGKNQNRKSKRETLAARSEQRDRDYNAHQWGNLSKDLQEKLFRFYPDKSATTDPTFGHPANAWANGLRDEAWSAISLMLSLRLRTPREQLKIEHLSLLKSLKASFTKLDHLSRDLDGLLGVGADVSGCRDKLKELIPRVDAAGDAISRLPNARKMRAAQHEAAIEMAIVVLRDLKNMGISTAATESSDAVKILKIIGDCLDLVLTPLTWKDIIIKAKKARPAIWRHLPASPRASALNR